MKRYIKISRPCEGREKIKSTEISGRTPMWFGRYEGWPLAAVPPDYLLWLYYDIRKLDPGLKRWISARKQYLSTQAYLAK